MSNILDMRYVIIFLLIALVSSCEEKTKPIENIEVEKLTEEQIDSILTDYNFNYNEPVFIDSTSQILLPITTQVSNDGTSSRLLKSGRGYKFPNSWNILFYNYETGETNLLTEEKVRISDFRTNIKEVGDILSNRILYKIKNHDFNNDNELNYEDPQYLYISQINGKEFKQISPKNESVQSYRIIPFTNQVLIKTRRDTNNNLKFDYDDELIWYKVDLEKSSKPMEIISDDMQEKIKRLYLEQWLIKEQ